MLSTIPNVISSCLNSAAQSASIMAKKAVDEDYRNLPEAPVGMDEEY